MPLFELLPFEPESLHGAASFAMVPAIAQQHATDIEEESCDLSHTPPTPDSTEPRASASGQEQRDRTLEPLLPFYG